MKKFISASLAMLALTGLNASADIIVKLPANSGVDSVSYYYAPIQKIATAKSAADQGIVQGKLAVKDNAATLAIPDEKGGLMYGLQFGPQMGMRFYAQPGENIVADVTSINPFDYTLSGSELINTMNEVAAIQKPIEQKLMELQASGSQDQEKMMAIYNEYTQAIKDYVEENLTNPNVLAAMINLQGEDFINAFDRLSERAKTSILYPIAEMSYNRAKEIMEKERQQQALADGTHPAPAFTLKDLEGKDVSLSDFKGKWVILDFWGSWCVWCIKGFPELKEAYAKYKDRLEVIGMDCKDSDEAWRKAVAKYELPWVNVYVPEGDALFKEYGIQAFPTKLIIGPDGMIRNLTVGHDPEFFNKLDALLAE